MPGLLSGKSKQCGKWVVRVVVAGDEGSGKSSLIATVANEAFPHQVPPVLSPMELLFDDHSNGVLITLVDTSSSSKDTEKVMEELSRADVVILTYACDRIATLESLSTFWLQELSERKVNVPVIVVGCKLDLRDDEQDITLKEVVIPIMQKHRQIETCIDCSALKQIQISEVINYAQRAVLHPTAPLFDQETRALRRECLSAFKRIFILCDADKDGTLCDEELNVFQERCFSSPLQPSEIDGVKDVVRENFPDGVNARGITLQGFLFLQALFIERGQVEIAWTALRKFGYDNTIRLRVHLPRIRFPDQSVELSGDAVEFLIGVFGLHAKKNVGFMDALELAELFSTAPDIPWTDSPYKDAFEKSVLDDDASECMSLDAFLSAWSLMTLLDPARSVEYLKYVGWYPEDTASAVRLTRRRRSDRKKLQSSRNVIQCFVLGPNKSGKSALLHTFIRSGDYAPPGCERYAVNSVHTPEGEKKTLVLREIPEGNVDALLSGRESLSPCDIAVFVYDSSDEGSWTAVVQLLARVADHGSSTGFEVPCLVISAKADLVSYPTIIQDSIQFTGEMGVQPPIPFSMKLGDINDLFCTVVSAAAHPHLNVPETEARRRHRRFHKLLNQSVLFATVGVGAALLGITAYRLYVARRTASSS